MPKDETAESVAGSGRIRPRRRGPTTDSSDGPLPQAALCSAMQESAGTVTNLELDQDTDIYKAKEVRGDWMCIRGNVAPTLLAFGEAAEVEAECERVIREVGNGGGLILGPGCEVPLNGRLENVNAPRSGDHVEQEDDDYQDDGPLTQRFLREVRAIERARVVPIGSDAAVWRCPSTPSTSADSRASARSGS